MPNDQTTVQAEDPKKREATDRYFDHLKYGNVCPFCGSEEIEGEQLDVNGTAATQQCYCHACDGVWTDTYQLKSAVLHTEKEKADGGTSEG